MIPWIQVYSNLIQHPKTYALADELKLTSKDASPNAVAAGMVVSLWLWAAQNAPDGDLGKCTTRAIAEAAEYKKKPDAFVDALIKVRFLDPDKKIHDWDEHASMLMDTIERSNENNAKRQQRYRDRKKQKQNATNNADVTPDSNVTCNVTNNGSNAPTVPNRTVPYQTVPNLCVTTGGTNLEAGTAGTPDGAPASMDGRSFTEFWKLYPSGKGGDREEAWKAWKALNPSTATAWRILDGLRDWVASEQWTEDGGRYIPNAAKFLREQRWLSPPCLGVSDPDSANGPYADTLAYVDRLLARKEYDHGTEILQGGKA